MGSMPKVHGAVPVTFYNETYFERGLESGVSCYQNYRWIPELTIPMAMTIIDYLKLDRDHLILDFGCAKGFLVKAFRLLYRRAWGLDVSRYAIENVDPCVENYCVLPDDRDAIPPGFDFCIAKDVFEHLNEPQLALELNRINSKRIFAVIPLGEDGMYRAPVNNCDRSHTICANEYWWIEFFKSCGWELEEFKLQLRGIKDHYYERFPDAHGFFVLRNNSEKSS